jgi:hypothetical protein
VTYLWPTRKWRCSGSRSSRSTTWDKKQALTKDSEFALTLLLMGAIGFGWTILSSACAALRSKWRLWNDAALAEAIALAQAAEAVVPAQPQPQPPPWPSSFSPSLDDTCYTAAAVDADSGYWSGASGDDSDGCEFDAEN